MTDVKAELLPCPFCGGKAHQWGNAANDGSGAVECDGCKTAVHRKTISEAIAAWNTRPQPSPKVDGLVEALKQICAYVRQAIDDGHLDAIVALDAIDDVACAAIKAVQP